MDGQFAPVRDLGLVAWWDDGDDVHCEPRAPYPHVREVLLTRARVEGAAVLSGGFSRTVAVQRLVDDASLRPIAAASVRGAVPRVRVAGEGHELDRDPAAASAHLPSKSPSESKKQSAHDQLLPTYFTASSTRSRRRNDIRRRDFGI